MTNASHKTFFGFQKVEEQEKNALVHKVFSDVAHKYDLMNDLMSFGLHRLWKKRMIHLLHPSAKHHLLDVAGGTADIGIRFLQQAPNAKVTICDINTNMLHVGRDNAINHNILLPMTWVCGNAESLPFPDHHFDFYTIAFGIRNVTHIPLALAEAWRVLKPGGRFLCLEFSHMNASILKKFYDQFSFYVIPKLGEIIADNPEPYRYLVESIRKFPSQAEFAKMITQAGFSHVTYQNLHQGIVALHSGWRI